MLSSFAQKIILMKSMPGDVGFILDHKCVVPENIPTPPPTQRVTGNFGLSPPPLLKIPV